MASNEDHWSGEELVLLSLLRGERIAGLLSSCDARSLRALAARHKLGARLASEIAAEGIEAGDWAHWAAAILLSAERDLSLYERGLERVRSILAPHGLPAVVIKGASLSLGSLRDVGDIDLLLPEAAMPEAIDLLESAGYSYVGKDRNRRIRLREPGDWAALSSWANQYELRDPETGALVELHARFFERGRVYAEALDALDREMEAIRAACVPDPSSGCLFLSLEDRAILLALHASIRSAPQRHAFILRHLDDFGRLVAAGLDWPLLVERARRFAVLPHLYFLCLLYRRLVGGSLPESALRSIADILAPSELWLERLHLRCLKDLSRLAYGSSLLYRYVLPFVLPCRRGSRIKSLLVLPLLFPEPWRIEQLYGLPRDSRVSFLLYPFEPLRWCRLLIENKRR